MDSFDPKTFGPQPSQRIATVLIYLTDVEEGGETVFKREGYKSEPFLLITSDVICPQSTHLNLVVPLSVVVYVQSNI
jgi:hypothetical protein